MTNNTNSGIPIRPRNDRNNPNTGENPASKADEATYHVIEHPEVRNWPYVGIPPGRDEDWEINYDEMYEKLRDLMEPLTDAQLDEILNI